MKLYSHKTDGGASYLCTRAVEGTNEGDMSTALIRLDGQPTLLIDPEEYLFRVVNATLKYAGVEMSGEDRADLVMLELINIK